MCVNSERENIVVCQAGRVSMFPGWSFTPMEEVKPSCVSGSQNNIQNLRMSPG